MQLQFYKNFVKFVLCMQNLLKKNVKKSDLPIIQLILEDFVEEANKLYGDSIMMSGMHEVLHLVKCTEDLGPLNSTNTFTFEEINRKILRFLHGRDLIGEEFIKHFTIYQALENFRNNFVKNEKLAEFLDMHTKFKSSNKKKNQSNSGLKYNKLAFKPFIPCKSINSLLLENELVDKENNYFTIDRVTFNGFVYTDVSNNSKNCDSYILNNSNYGCIEKIIIFQESAYFVCNRLIRLLPSFHSEKFPSVKSYIFSASSTEEKFICKIDNANKICFMNINDSNIIFLCDLNISHLFH